ncbi:pleckstrin domain-containing [Musa troglodytarum]|uniref:Pleckstrin domain-containing n=1 Tax=Musa troglodytarum TaxID=320322 RepID=A0A9E7JR43_9LILI|nr:pleckstrin domain-containing [Musa troglodytarum]
MCVPQTMTPCGRQEAGERGWRSEEDSRVAKNSEDGEKERGGSEKKDFGTRVRLCSPWENWILVTRKPSPRSPHRGSNGENPHIVTGFASPRLIEAGKIGTVALDTILPNVPHDFYYREYRKIMQLVLFYSLIQLNHK